MKSYKEFVSSLPAEAREMKATIFSAVVFSSPKQYTRNTIAVGLIYCLNLQAGLRSGFTPRNTTP
jgi:hypothetical protein